MEQAGLKSSVEATREASFLLAKPEKRLLTWIAARLRRRVLPDDLTLLGVLAAFGICAAYQLSNDSIDWLWLASGLITWSTRSRRRRSASGSRRSCCSRSGP